MLYDILLKGSMTPDTEKNLVESVECQLWNKLKGIVLFKIVKTYYYRELKKLLKSVFINRIRIQQNS